MHEANRRSIYSAPEISGRSFCGNRDHCLLGTWVHAHSLGPPPREAERTVDSNCPGKQREGHPLKSRSCGFSNDQLADGRQVSAGTHVMSIAPSQHSFSTPILGGPVTYRAVTESFTGFGRCQSKALTDRSYNLQFQAATYSVAIKDEGPH